MFDVQVVAHRRGDLPEQTLASIAGYYRRVTTAAHPMNRLIAAVMLGTLAALVLEIVSTDTEAWVAWASLALALGPIVLAAARTVPHAVRLGARVDPPSQQAAQRERFSATTSCASRPWRRCSCCSSHLRDSRDPSLSLDLIVQPRHGGRERTPRGVLRACSRYHKRGRRELAKSPQIAVVSSGTSVISVSAWVRKPIQSSAIRHLPLMASAKAHTHSRTIWSRAARVMLAALAGAALWTSPATAASPLGGVVGGGDQTGFRTGGNTSPNPSPKRRPRAAAAARQAAVRAHRAPARAHRARRRRKPHPPRRAHPRR